MKKLKTHIKYRPVTVFVDSMQALTDVMLLTSAAMMTSRCQDHTQRSLLGSDRHTYSIFTNEVRAPLDAMSSAVNQR